MAIEIRDTLQVERLLQSFQDYQAAKEARDRCYYECEMSPSYHCGHLDNEVSKYAAEIEDRLNEILGVSLMKHIEEIVEQKVNERLGLI